MSTLNTGMVYWFTGLAGSGKTTLGKLFFEHLKAQKQGVVFLDGDILRPVFGDDLGHTVEDRHKSAMRNARLCKLLSDQGIDVVCSTISLFHTCQEWNRANIPAYREIFIRVPMDILIRRDQKGLYSRALAGAVQNVVGIDIPAEEPLHPDVVLDNTGELSPQEMVRDLIERLNLPHILTD